VFLSGTGGLVDIPPEALRDQVETLIGLREPPPPVFSATAGHQALLSYNLAGGS